MENTKKPQPREPKPRGHFGNNGLKGKSSNNKGRKRGQKLPRRSKLDMELSATGKEELDSDTEEDLPLHPLSIHYYRSAFIRLWCSKVGIQEIHEDSIIKAMLGHGPDETSCIFLHGEQPSCATVDHLRTKIRIKGKPSYLPPIKRESDRHVRAYHFWMYNSGRWTRNQLAVMSAEGQDAIGASHVCGGSCLNHTIPEANSLNQARKKHHAQMLAALEKGNVASYKTRRNNCNHRPKCFINPAARNLNETIRKVNEREYQQQSFVCT